MVTINTKLLPRAELATFLPSPRAIKAFEDAQADIQSSGDVIGKLQTAPILTLDNSASATLTGARILTLGTDLSGVDGGPKGAYELSLKPTGVVANTYGGDQAWPSITIDVKGRATSAVSKAFAVTAPIAYDAPTRTFSFSGGAQLLPAGGTTGQVLTKTSAADYATNWQTPSGGGSGLSLIQRIVIGAGGASSVSFTGIPGTFEELRLTISGRVSAADITVNLRMNGDTGANYSFIGENRFGFSGTIPGATSVQAGLFTNGGNTSGLNSIADIRIPGYARTVFWKTMGGVNNCFGTTENTGNTFRNASTGSWRNTAAITQLDFFVATGLMLQGSVFSLYGVS
jgi:hypothetical protein